MRDDPQLLSKRLRTFVEPYSAKTLAELVGCDVRTAENIRQGHWPIARHWLGLVSAFSRDITDAVFHPDAARERLEREVAQLEQQLADRHAALRVVAKETASFRPRMATAQGRVPTD